MRFIGQLLLLCAGVAARFGDKQGVASGMVCMTPADLARQVKQQQPNDKLADQANDKLAGLEGGDNWKRNVYSGGFYWDDRSPGLDSFMAKMPHGGQDVRISFGQLDMFLWWPKAYDPPVEGWSKNLQDAWATFDRKLPTTRTWEPGTLVLMDHLIDQDTVYIGFGAWIGPTALFAAARAKSVHIFEPDPYCFPDLMANLLLNPQLTANKVNAQRQCISTRRHMAQFVGIGGSGSGKVEFLGDHKTLMKEQPKWYVQCDRLLDSLKRMAKGPRFVSLDLPSQNKLYMKIDTEGAESTSLPRRVAPTHGAMRSRFALPVLTLLPVVRPPAPQSRSYPTSATCSPCSPATRSTSFSAPTACTVPRLRPGRRPTWMQSSASRTPRPWPAG
jgi:FkbM family methyltransferase